MSHFMPESRAHVGICLPCDLAGALDALVGAQSCNCPQAIAFLMRIGAPLAARMHAAEAEKSTTEWTIGDWLSHMKEEEDYLFPILPQAVAARLMQDHNRFRMELSIYGDIKSITLLDQHFHAEEEWCEYLMARLPDGDASASVSGTDTTGTTSTSAPPGQFVAVLAIGFGLAMLALRYFKAR